MNFTLRESGSNVSLHRRLWAYPPPAPREYSTAGYADGPFHSRPQTQVGQLGWFLDRRDRFH